MGGGALRDAGSYKEDLQTYSETRKAVMALSWLFLLMLAASSVSSARIAGFHMIGGSQYINTKLVLEELASRGHEVTLVISSSQKVKPSEEVPHKIYKVPYKPNWIEDLMNKYLLQGHQFQYMFKFMETLVGLCEAALNSSEVLDQLRGFDLIIYDNLAFCGPLIGEHLGLQKVEFLPLPPSGDLLHRTPRPISYTSYLWVGLTDKMSFFERLVSLGAYIGGEVMVYLAITRPFNALKVKYNIKPDIDFRDSACDTQLLIMTADFAVEYPQPLLPDQVMVGPLTVKEAKPLPPDLEEFVSSSGGNGFIIVSFGSNVGTLSQATVDTLAEAFGKLKQQVVWKLQGYIPPSVSPNIKIVKWLPQIDLLGHKDIKAFVSHGGHNSVYESTYHGVPLVAFPLFSDQPANAKKITHLGLGLRVDYQNFTAQEMFEKIELVIKEPRFKAKAIHISGLIKDRKRTPLQETGDWIEYVLRHGGARHLRAQVFNIPWYQYYLLDVIAFLVAMITLAVMVIRLTCSCICRLCCKKDSDKAKKE